MTARLSPARATAQSSGARRHTSAWSLQIPALVGLTFILVPLLALLLRVEWGELATHLSRPVVGQSLRLSAVTTSVTMVLVWLLGTPLAWLLARSESRLTAWARALVTVPLVLPPVVGGVALLMAWGRRGVVGGPLEAWFGITVPFTTVAVVMAELFVALPFYVVAVEGAMRGLDRRYDDVAATLGSGPVRTFATVVWGASEKSHRHWMPHADAPGNFSFTAGGPPLSG